MGQKVHPNGFRLGVIRDWDSKWYAERDYQRFLHEDLAIRKFLKAKLFHAGISKITSTEIFLNIIEVRKVETDAILVAENIAAQLEKRVSFRRAMKKAMTQSRRAGAKGVKVMCAGRLGGAEMSRTEWYRDGRVPLHTLRADIDFGVAEAKTTYGVIGVKVWIFKGEILPGEEERAA